MRRLACMLALLLILHATAAVAAESEHFAFFELEFTGKLRTGPIADRASL